MELALSRDVYMLLKIVLGLCVIWIAISFGKKLILRNKRQRKETEEQLLSTLKQHLDSDTIESKKEILEFDTLWKDRLSSLLIIDSNIWMNEEHEALFEELEWIMGKYLSTLKMSSIQFDHIVNLKHLPDENSQNVLAKCAFLRIETLQTKGLIDIIPMQVTASEHADSDIIAFLVEASKTNPTTTLLSDDKALIIRANQIMNDKSTSDFMSITGTDLYIAINNYHENLEFIELGL